MQGTEEYHLPDTGKQLGWFDSNSLQLKLTQKWLLTETISDERGDWFDSSPIGFHTQRRKWHLLNDCKGMH
jgi:hypothetical protein